MTQSRATTEKNVQALPAEGSEYPWPLVLDFSAVEMTGDQFVKFCSDNGNYRFEITGEGELLVMPPAFSRSGWREGQVYFQVESWARENGTGLTFGPSAGFTFPNGSIRSPDISWVLRERWEQWEERLLSESKADSFAALVPDFVIEVRSTSDLLPTIQAKLEEYISNGVQLGWLIDPLERLVHVYQDGQAVQLLENPETVSGDRGLPGFVLNLSEIW